MTTQTPTPAAASATAAPSELQSEVYHHCCRLSPALLSCRSYAFAFGDPNPNADGTFSYHNPFIGHRYFVQLGLPRGYGVPPMNANYVQWFFQFTFASTSATIVRCGVHIPMFAFLLFAVW